MDPQEIITRIHTLYPGARIDVAGENCSFELFVIDDAFGGMGTLQRQRPILALFTDELASGKLHALSVKARTPVEQQAEGGLVSLQMS